MYDPDVEQVLGFLMTGATNSPPPSSAVLLFSQPGAPKVPEHAAALMLADKAPLVIVSGGVSASGILAPGGVSEAQYYRKILHKQGIRDGRMLLDERSSNTEENVTNGMQVAHEAGFEIKSVILVSVPPHLMRCALTFQKHFPRISVSLSTYSFNREVWCSNEGGILRILGEIERITRYFPGVVIPPEIKEAYIAAREHHGLPGTGPIKWTEGHLWLD